jgi:RNA polymerase sigma-70 factor (ECF subfamily)
MPKRAVVISSNRAESAQENRRIAASGNPEPPAGQVAQGGNEDRDARFHQLFKDYYGPVRYYFSTRGLATEECRDLTQETFKKAYKAFEGYREEASHKTWLLKIAKHVWLNFLRGTTTAKRGPPAVSIEGLDDQPASDLVDTDSLDPEEGLLQNERVTLVRRALAELPPQRRRCLLLRLEGLKYREIAELLNISLQSVRSHLFQARAQMRELLGGHFGDDEVPGGEGDDDE